MWDVLPTRGFWTSASGSAWPVTPVCSRNNRSASHPYVSVFLYRGINSFYARTPRPQPLSDDLIRLETVSLVCGRFHGRPSTSAEVEGFARLRHHLLRMGFHVPGDPRRSSRGPAIPAGGHALPGGRNRPLCVDARTTLAIANGA